MTATAADQLRLRLAEESDAGLVVVGSRGLDGVRRAHLGSTSASVVSHAHAPVLVVREKAQAGSREATTDEGRERSGIVPGARR